MIFDKSPHSFSEFTISCTKLYTRTNTPFQAFVLTVTMNASSMTTAHYSCYCNFFLPGSTFTYASILVLSTIPFKRYQMKHYLYLSQNCSSSYVMYQINSSLVQAFHRLARSTELVTRKLPPVLLHL